MTSAKNCDVMNKRQR